MLILFLQNNFPRMFILTFFTNSDFIFIPKQSIDLNYLASFVIIWFLGDLSLLYLLGSQWETVDQIHTTVDIKDGDCQRSPPHYNP